MPWQGCRKAGLPKTSSGGRSPRASSRCGPYRSARIRSSSRARWIRPVFQGPPLGRRDQERDRVELPGPVHPPGVAVDVVGDAVLADQVLRFLPAAADLVGAQRLEGVDERLPVRPDAVAREPSARRTSRPGRGSASQITGPGRRRRATRGMSRLRSSWVAWATTRSVRHCGSGQSMSHDIISRTHTANPGAAARSIGLERTRFDRRPAEVERQREFGMPLQRRHLHRARRMAEREEPGMAPALGLVGVDREGLVGQPAGMDDVVGAAADRPFQPGVDRVEDQRRVDRDGRVQARGRLPGAVADARDELAVGPGRSAAARGGRCRSRTCRPSVSPWTFTWSRSTDEST